MAARPAVALTVGRLAKAAGVSVETIRYYQRRGLIAAPAKPLGGFRRYGLDAVASLRGIRRAQQAGFALAEVAVLMRLDRRRDRKTAHALAVKKIAQIDQRIETLRALSTSLGALADACQRGDKDIACPILEAFAGSDDAEGSIA